ncbi:MAG: lactate utilization protein [Anaeromyxobacter sp.]
MLETFRARAEAVSARVHRAAGKAEAVEVVLALLAKEGVSAEPGRTAVWAEGPLLAGLDRAALAARAPGLGFEVTRETAAAARAGVTEVDWLVANTGTIAAAADAVAPRLAASLPDVHVAIASAARIVPDLAALFARLGPAQTRYLSLTTGPSRTADIERVLTIGVHGPARLHVVVVDGAERA